MYEDQVRLRFGLFVCARFARAAHLHAP